MGKLVMDDTLKDTNFILRSMCQILVDQQSPRNENIIYGFHINGAESDPVEKVTYLMDAVCMTPVRMDTAHGAFNWGSWENAFFIPKPCMLKYDGTVDYYLNPLDYTKKEDGTNSDVNNINYEGNAMMEWGQNGNRIYYKIVPDSNDNTSASVYIANYAVDSTYHCYSFINKYGELTDHFYTPCYFGSIINGKLRSMSGVSGANRCSNKTAEQERTLAQQNGEIWDIEFYCDVVLINLLLILIAKSTNTQAIFGEGLTTSGNDVVNNSFISGQHDKQGLFWGTNNGISSIYTNAVKIFGMENWWGFMYRRLNGLININGTIKYKLTYNTEDGSTTSNYVTSYISTSYDGYITGNTLPSISNTYIDTMIFDDKQFAPFTANGTASTYYTDGLQINNNQADLAYRGGYSNSKASTGTFCLSLTGTSMNTSWYLGAAPSAKPLISRYKYN